jgi:hypothetical protein
MPSYTADVADDRSLDRPVNRELRDGRPREKLAGVDA